jgi:hypothetical protein
VACATSNNTERDEIDDHDGESSFSNSMSVVLIVWMKVEADADELRCFDFRLLMGLESVTESLNDLQKKKNEKPNFWATIRAVNLVPR